MEWNISPLGINSNRQYSKLFERFVVCFGLPYLLQFVCWFRLFRQIVPTCLALMLSN